jgi:hypothetical protein
MDETFWKSLSQDVFLTRNMTCGALRQPCHCSRPSDFIISGLGEKRAFVDVPAFYKTLEMLNIGDDQVVLTGVITLLLT